MITSDAKGWWELILEMCKHRLGQAVLIATGAGFAVWYVMGRRLDIEVGNSLKKDETIAELKTERDYWRDAFLRSDDGCLEKFKALFSFSQMIQEENERTRQAIISTTRRANKVLEDQQEVLNGVKNKWNKEE